MSTLLELSNNCYKQGYDKENWFKVAETDYLELIKAVDWSGLFSGFGSSFNLLDAGCGTGKFPSLFTSHVNLPNKSIIYDYLDPSSYSLSMLPKALNPPFSAGKAFLTTLQDFPFR